MIRNQVADEIWGLPGGCLRFPALLVASISASCFDLSSGSAAGWADRPLLIRCPFHSRIRKLSSWPRCHLSGKFPRPG